MKYPNEHDFEDKLMEVLSKKPSLYNEETTSEIHARVLELILSGRIRWNDFFSRFERYQDQLEAAFEGLEPDQKQKMTLDVLNILFCYKPEVSAEKYKQVVEQRQREIKACRVLVESDLDLGNLGLEKVESTIKFDLEAIKRAQKIRKSVPKKDARTFITVECLKRIFDGVIPLASRFEVEPLDATLFNAGYFRSVESNMKKGGTAKRLIVNGFFVVGHNIKERELESDLANFKKTFKTSDPFKLLDILNRIKLPRSND